MFNIRHPQKTWFGVGSVSKVVEEVNFLNGNISFSLPTKEFQKQVLQI